MSNIIIVTILSRRLDNCHYYVNDVCLVSSFDTTFRDTVGHICIIHRGVINASRKRGRAMDDVY